jgi:hypothetical protein
MSDDDDIRSKAIVCIKAFMEMLQTADDENNQLRFANEQLKKEINDLSSEVARLYKDAAENRIDTKSRCWPEKWMEEPADPVRKVVDDDRLEELGLRQIRPKDADACLWSRQEPYFDFEIWDSACGKTFYFYDGKGPHYNGFKYCPYCGKELIEKEVSNEA